MGLIDIIKPLSLFEAAPSINLSNIKRKILENAENRTGGCWVRSEYATSVLCSPKKLFYFFHRMCEWRSLFSITTDTSRRARSAPCRSRWRTSRCWRRRRRRSPRSPTSSPSKNRLVQAFYKAHPSTIISRPFRWTVQVPKSSKSLISLDQFGKLY